MRPSRTSSRPRNGARLLARPATPSEASLSPGLHHLTSNVGRDTLLLVPRSLDETRPVPLALMLHGAGGDARHGIELLQSLADAAGVLLLAPASRGPTWDVLMGDYVENIEAALHHVFARFMVDARRMAVGGFSDGASYALSLGVTNGDGFSHVLACSPGFMAPSAQHGGPSSPRIYISHGTSDTVLPIDRCSRRIVPQLQRAGYNLTYREFNGPHTIPPEVAREALAFLLA
jgi:phospholipase/carboxylesterase